MAEFSEDRSTTLLGAGDLGRHPVFMHQRPEPEAGATASQEDW
ncbi:MAG: hypothetical protein ACJAZN_001046 [Planctomycetota bacterium]|jgi:hypothetical protein